MQAEVDKAAAAAREVVDLKKSLQDSIDGANFLSEKKRNGVLTIALLNDLTGRLNDDTYLERLSVERNQIQIQGQSKEAASLINVLGDSPFLGNPKLEGQIQPDPRTGKDRFTISAEPRSAVPAQAGQDTQDPGLQATVSGDGEPKEDSDGTP
jgi:general secretion pathway protein L